MLQMVFCSIAGRPPWWFGRPCVPSSTWRLYIKIVVPLAVGELLSMDGGGYGYLQAGYIRCSAAPGQMVSVCILLLLCGKERLATAVVNMLIITGGVGDIGRSRDQRLDPGGFVLMMTSNGVLFSLFGGRRLALSTALSRTAA